MKKYIIVAYGRGEMYKPRLFSNKQEAYLHYTVTLLNQLEHTQNINEEEYYKYKDIISEKTPKEIKNAITELMKKYVNDNTIREVTNGYSFCNNDEHNDYIIEFFEVEES